MPTQYYTGANAEFAPLEIFPSLTIPGATTAEPTKTPSTEGFIGFGVAITGSSCYQLSKMDAGKRAAMSLPCAQIPRN